MPVITRCSNDVIEGAYKLIGVFSEDRNLPQQRIDEALYYFNALLDQFASSTAKIAYNQTVSFPLVIGQASYEISNKVGADVSNNPFVILNYVTLRDGTIDYPVSISSDDIFYKNTRDTTTTGRPRQCFLQNQVDESNLTFFVLPDKAYTCTLIGKVTLDHVTLNTDLTEVPAYYHLFLEYALGRILHSRYPGSTWDQQAEDSYQRMKDDLEAANDVNLSVKTGPALLGDSYYGRNILSI